MPRAGLTRDRIIQAAAALADEQGFDTVTLAALARGFNVRLPSLYGHMANSDDLKKSIALHALRLLAERTEEAIAGRSGREALIALTNVHRNFGRQHPGLFSAARYPLDPDIVPDSGAMRLSRANHAMLRGYDLDEEGRVHATRVIGAFVLGFSLLELAGSFGHSMPDPEMSWTRGIDALDVLIRSWAKA